MVRIRVSAKWDSHLVCDYNCRFTETYLIEESVRLHVHSSTVAAAELEDLSVGKSGPGSKFKCLPEINS